LKYRTKTSGQTRNAFSYDPEVFLSQACRCRKAEAPRRRCVDGLQGLGNTSSVRAGEALFRGLPPTLVQVGPAETLLDDAVRFTAAAGTRDVFVTLEIWPDLIQAWPLWNARLQEGRRALGNAGAFLRRNFQAPLREGA
jgi:acetyl esterase/lipase